MRSLILADLTEYNGQGITLFSRDDCTGNSASVAFPNTSKGEINDIEAIYATSAQLSTSTTKSVSVPVGVSTTLFKEENFKGKESEKFSNDNSKEGDGLNKCFKISLDKVSSVKWDKID